MAVAYDPYEEEDYYTLTNRTFAGDRFAPGSEGAIAFDAPSAGGVRYPVAMPSSGGQVGTFGAATPEWQRMIEEVSAQNRPAATAQYGAEMARADRNAIADAGEDPQAVQQAIRVRGTLKYNNLIAGGATPAEALRLTANEIYFNHPAAQVSAMNHSIPSMRTPDVSTMELPGGGTAVLSGGRVHSVKWNRDKDPLKVLDEKEAQESVTRAMRELATLQKGSVGGLLPPDPAALKAAEDKVEAARLNRRNLIRGVSTPTPPPSEDLEEVIRVTSDGKRAVFDAKTKKFLRYAR